MKRLTPVKTVEALRVPPARAWPHSVASRTRAGSIERRRRWPVFEVRSCY